MKADRNSASRRNAIPDWKKNVNLELKYAFTANIYAFTTQ